MLVFVFLLFALYYKNLIKLVFLQITRKNKLNLSIKIKVFSKGDLFDFWSDENKSASREVDIDFTFVSLSQVLRHSSQYFFKVCSVVKFLKLFDE